ncbi:hypothetical protein E1I69_08110 [Bacillus timonensis]|uniref:Uncharacterized protein n=1 Tax=Bacillus timonensis TaxID=1033734 RepID=A0A4S3PUF9_9BACI|nr:hypothetical protein [Bacillus timonensis]THE13298.1 hypothetical protein E1I69_08110 [Bacillus timonensis]
MKLLRIIPFVLFMMLLAGCNKGELQWYEMVVFKPVETPETIDTWSAQLQYVNYSEMQETPPDILKLTYNGVGSPVPNTVTFHIQGTSISGEIELAADGTGEAIIDREQLLDFLDTIILEDGTITGSIPLVLNWGDLSEELTLPYLTAIKDFEKTTLDKFLKLFS